MQTKPRSGKQCPRVKSKVPNLSLSISLGLLRQREATGARPAKVLVCPKCSAVVCDEPFASKLAKCWNCFTAFDTMD